VRDFVEMVARALADKPDEVRVTESDEGDTLTLDLDLAEEDLGRVIGREGRTVRALRAVASAAGRKHNRRVYVRIRG
jgi:predicted RNA-binding protein YlqC (UPF0109 family)